MENSRKKRRSKLPQPRFQLRLAGAFACLCALALLTELLVFAASVSWLANRLSAGGPQLAEALPWLLVRVFVISFALVLPALLVIGIRITFRIAGPLYRLERHMKQVAGGAWPGRCSIRRNDDLQEFCTLLNDALESSRSQGEAAGRRAPCEEQRTAG